MRALCLFHERDALVADQLARIVTFVAALANKPVAHHAAVIQTAEWDHEPIAKSCCGRVSALHQAVDISDQH